MGVGGWACLVKWLCRVLSRSGAFFGPEWGDGPMVKWGLTCATMVFRVASSHVPAFADGAETIRWQRLGWGRCRRRLQWKCSA